MRRLLAVTTCLSMLHLSLVAGDLACATHGAHRAVSVTQDHTGMPAGGSVQHAPDTRPSPDCPARSLPQCCDSLAACGPSIALGSRLSIGSIASARLAIPRANATHLASRARGPEPPPPKA